MDQLAHYMKHIGKTPLLTRQEEGELGRRVQAGDRSAADRMVSANLRLVFSIAKSYKVWGADFEDAIAAGNLGLCEAVQRFDPSLGIRVSTYATSWIRMRISKLLRQNSVIRVPDYLYDLVPAWRKAVARMREEGLDPTPGTVCERLAGRFNTSRKLVSNSSTCVDAAQTAMMTVSVGNNDYPCRVDRPAERQINEDMEWMVSLFGTLSPREALVLQERYGLDGEPVRTLLEIATRLNVSKERVRQIQNVALRKLRKKMSRPDTVTDGDKL